jgi:glycosyltransferase involved in cell wall biosynthesis
MKTVLIYKDVLLRISETFIAAQVGALKNFQPKYVGLRQPTPSQVFDGKPVYLAHGQGALSKVRSRLYQFVPVAPFFHLQIRRHRADLIHAHFAPDGLHAARLAMKLQIPLIVTLHGYDVTVSQNFAARYSQLWKQASLFLCVSGFIRRKALEAGFPPDKLLVHHIGIDTGKFQPPAEPRVHGLILFVGRLTEKKGCEALLRALDIVRETVPGAHLAAIGEGPLRPTLEALASSLRLPCEFLGPQPPAKVREWMQKASILCAPSQTASDGDSEGLPMVILEAMAVGLPIVSTFHAGIPEAVADGKSGLLSPEGDVHSLAQSLIRYLQFPELAAQHAAAGIASVREEFNLTKQTSILENVYDKVLLR